MQTRHLSKDEFKATFTPKMKNVTQTTTDVIDIWPYVSSIPATDLKGHATYDQLVEYVYRGEDDCFDYVLVMTRTKNIYLVVVVDLVHDVIFGHLLLDLNKEYGLS